jgi:hypothetical protein
MEQESVERSDELKEEDRARINLVKSFVRESTKAKDPYLNEWNQNLLFYYGRQMKKAKMEKGMADVVVNACFLVTETIRAIFLSAEPKTYIYPTVAGYENLSRKLETMKEWLWKVTNLRSKVLGKVGFHIPVYGTSIFELGWNAAKNIPVIRAVRPHQFIIDPDASDIEDAMFAGTVRPVSVKWLRYKYGDKAKNVRSCEIPEEYERAESLIHGERGHYSMDGGVSPSDMVGKEFREYGETETGKNTSLHKTGGVPEYSRQRTLLYSIIFRDMETMEKKIDPETGEEYEDLKYPGGRKIVFADNSILEDVRNPDPDGEYPYVPCRNYIVDDGFFATGDLTQIIPINKMLNAGVNQVIDQRNLYGDPPLIYEKGSVDEAVIQNWHSRPGAKIPMNQNAQKWPSYLEGPSLPAWQVRLIPMAIEFIEWVSSVHAVMTGQEPGRVESGKAIQSLQKMANVRGYLKSVNLEEALKEVTRKGVRLMQHNMAPGEIIRLRPNPNRMPEIPDQVEIDEEISDLRFEIDVETGSTMPRNPQQEQEVVMGLIQGGMIPDMLDSLRLIARSTRLPHLDIIIKKMEAVQQQEEEMAAQQQGAMPPQQQEMMPPGAGGMAPGGMGGGMVQPPAPMGNQGSPPPLM